SHIEVVIEFGSNRSLVGNFRRSFDEAGANFHKGNQAQFWKKFKPPLQRCGSGSINRPRALKHVVVKRALVGILRDERKKILMRLGNEEKGNKFRSPFNLEKMAVVHR